MFGMCQWTVEAANVSSYINYMLLLGATEVGSSASRLRRCSLFGVLALNSSPNQNMVPPANMERVVEALSKPEEKSDDRYNRPKK